MIDGHPDNVTRRVRATIRRAHEAGLVATATTDPPPNTPGAHAAGSWHYPMKGRNANGCAVDVGFSAHDIEHLSADVRRLRLVRFQILEYRRAKRFKFRTWQEIIGPNDEYVVLGGKRADLARGSALERQHENHVHIARSPMPRVPRRPRPRRVSRRGIQLVADFEEFMPQIYNDPVGVRTIGYGETNSTILAHYSHGITERQARALLRRRLNRDYAPAVRALHVPTQGAFDALCSFVYNVGPGALSPATSIGKALHRKAWRAAADALLAWDKAGNPPHSLSGLIRRRRAERSLFLSRLK
jgi:lysozyme